ncbi:hypothetical protein NDU88_006977 [Pleurodeles waltl]|uniref:Uncharacterized protein n=1 Tax=Pleurodeles waltl TaxID=8319 RepID=A0AAV7VSZ2_PLEWA|nr:hypothetical protein NDU88_006977 [Pleurodeles waltl]
MLRGTAGPADRAASFAGLSLPQVLAWGPRGLELVPSDLVADGGKKAPEEQRAELLVLLSSAGLAAQASGTSLVRRSGETLVGPTSVAVDLLPATKSAAGSCSHLVLRNQASVVANGVELEAVLKGPLCC